MIYHILQCFGCFKGCQNATFYSSRSFIYASQNVSFECIEIISLRYEGQYTVAKYWVNQFLEESVISCSCSICNPCADSKWEFLRKSFHVAPHEMTVFFEVLLKLIQRAFSLSRSFWHYLLVACTVLLFTNLFESFTIQARRRNLCVIWSKNIALLSMNRRLIKLCLFQKC